MTKEEKEFVEKNLGSYNRSLIEQILVQSRLLKKDPNSILEELLRVKNEINKFIFEL